MVILGLILVLLALLLGVALLVGASSSQASGQDIDLQFLDTVTISLDPLMLILAGMLAMFLLWLGLVTIKWALTRKAQAKRDRKNRDAPARGRRGRREHDRREQERATGLEQERGAPRDGSGAPAGGAGPTARDGGPGDSTQRIPRDTPAEDATRPISRDDTTRPIRRGDGRP